MTSHRDENYRSRAMVLEALLLLVLTQQGAHSDAPTQETSAESTEDTQKEKEKKGFDAAVIPLPNFNSDLGAGLGVVGGAYIYKPGYSPYRFAFAAEIFHTTRGVSVDWIRFDAPDLFPRVRVELRFDFFKQPFAPYYGPGNLTVPGFASVPGGKERFFTYDRLTMGGWVRARFSPFGKEHPLHAYVAYSYRWNRVRPFPDSLLEQQQPLGSQGGRAGGILAGLYWDTRDVEGQPTKGGIIDVSTQTFLVPLGSSFNYEQLTLSAKHYWTVAPKLVLASRLAIDALLGDVPFYAWPTSGGVYFFGGVGGSSTVRGVTLNRYSGEYQVLLNGELRWLPIEFRLLKVNTHVGLAGFLDLGRVWQPGVEDGSFFHFHVGTGGGLRLTRREAVIRVDYAEWLGARHRALYITFGEAF
ncbi:BamA/TamA family outer membrane protein [Vitiosangium sp. GDMCC 1.1324]|uniref:Omp85 family outer membrane protein n=1 Tax=Vitiosangium sp. (strain GDMCC 1.1324) TaxID=2138576 RepID=UPI000D348AED|nr:BamA/TamA family outer membrane protein [Vitiosangium sp. GDMCC 1.1324]PTL78850.1 hypothetical protein DAT35_37990 [Vitiosangium sp. GDMCC 1.1324]